MVAFAWTAISSFSALPLKLSLLGGLALTTFGLLYLAYVAYETLVLHTTVRGWSSLVCFQILFSGATLTAVGLVGDYVARIYEELKGRPLYVLVGARNIEPRPSTPPRALLVRGRHSDAPEGAASKDSEGEPLQP
jgi:dolichol-phosphate mannosyltransferase